MKYHHIAALAFAVFLLFGPHPAKAACSNPTQPEGYLMYNQAQHVLQFCNGTDWKSVGGDATNACPYMNGVCPTSNSSAATCHSGEVLSWSTVSCTVSSGVQTIVFNSPLYTGVAIGGADASEALDTAQRFCNSYGLGMSSVTSAVAGGQYYDFQPTTAGSGLLLRNRGTASSNKISQITCLDILAIP